MYPVFFIGFCLIVCLLPLSFYLLYIAQLNASKTRTLLSGTRDLMYLILGVIGFLIIGGPLILSVIGQLVSGTEIGVRLHRVEMNMQQQFFWTWCMLFYVFSILVASLWLFWFRSSNTVIYHLERKSLDAILNELMVMLSLTYKKIPRGYLIDPPIVKSPPNMKLSNPGPSEFAILEVNSFEKLEHSTLRWRADFEWLRPRFEFYLQEELLKLDLPPNPASKWLFTFGLCLFASLMLCLAWLIVQMIQLI